MSSFTFGTFKYILMLILLYFYLSSIFNAGPLLVTEYFFSVVLPLLLKVKDPSTSSTMARVIRT